MSAQSFGETYHLPKLHLPEGHLLCRDGGYMHIPSFFQGLAVGTSLALIIAIIVLAIYFRDRPSAREARVRD